MPASKPGSDATFRSPRWAVAFLITCTITLALASVYCFQSDGLSIEFAIASVFGFVTALGSADLMTTSVKLFSGRLTITSNFRTREFARTDIEKVTWESGVGVSLQLKSGIWTSLPDVGNSQSVANSIRAWLKRSKDGT